VTDKLPHITAAKLLADWDARIVPAHVPPEDFGRLMVRNSYAGGFGAAILLLQKLETMPADDRAAILKRLGDEVQTCLLAAGNGEGLPRA
jgi:hypothetical protein